MPNSAAARPHHPDILPLQPRLRAHLIGIAGSGMRSLADVLTATGYEVAGSDPRAASLPATRYRVSAEHRADLIDRAVTLVVYSDAVPQDNPELVRARALGMRTISYAQMLGELMQSRTGAAVAGTHGKSTATALAGAIMAHAGLDPTVIYGAEPADAACASRLGRGRWMLAEACEFRENFRHLRPQMAAILGIEYEHVDCFASLDEVEAAYARFARQLPSEGLLLVRDDCPVTRRASDGIACRRETFGFGPTATWQATAVRVRRGYYSFEFRCQKRLVCEVTMPLAGRHNVLNALAAAALASHCGAGASSVRAGIRHFGGLRRRLELVADNGPYTVVDDYAHHPTEVAAVLSTVREMFPERRLWCVFEPHQALRTVRLLDDFARALHNADKLIVTDVFAARETPPAGGPNVALELTQRVGKLGVDAQHLASIRQIEHYLPTALRPGDLVVTLGAGNIGALAHDLGQRLRTIRQAS